jgi:hypothetical protein
MKKKVVVRGQKYINKLKHVKLFVIYENDLKNGKNYYLISASIYFSRFYSKLFLYFLFKRLKFMLLFVYNKSIVFKSGSIEYFPVGSTTR